MLPTAVTGVNNWNVGAGLRPLGRSFLVMAQNDDIRAVAADHFYRVRQVFAFRGRGEITSIFRADDLAAKFDHGHFVAKASTRAWFKEEGNHSFPPKHVPVKVA